MRTRALLAIVVAGPLGLAGCRALEWVAPLEPWDVPVADRPALVQPVETVYQEPSGAFWLATGGGAIRFDPRTGILTRLTTRDGLASDAVHSFQLDVEGDLWLGTDGALSRFDRRTGRIDFTPEGRGKTPDLVATAERPWKPELGGSVPGEVKAAPGKLDGMSISALYREEGAGGALWAWAENQLARLDPATGETRFFPPPRQRVGTVQALYRAAGGPVWLATSAGIVRLEAATGAVTPLLRRPGFPANDLEGLWQESGGALWLAGSGSLVRLDPATGRLTVPAPGLLQEGDRVAAFVQERGGGPVWLATNRSLIRFDPRSGSWSQVTAADGLPGWVTVLHQERAGGPLWLVVNGVGVSRFDPQTSKFRNYGEADGLPSRSVSYFGRDPAGGALLAGGSRGVARFDPAADRFVPWPPAREVAGRLDSRAARRSGGEDRVDRHAGRSPPRRPRDRSLHAVLDAAPQSGERRHDPACPPSARRAGSVDRDTAEGAAALRRPLRQVCTLAR